jgi:hypothetical protein
MGCSHRRLDLPANLQYAPSTHPPQYPGPQGQIRSASYQDQRYQPEPPNNAAAFSMPNVPGYGAHPSQRASPRCRYPNCDRPVAMDRETQEFDEYCSHAHMVFVVALQALVVLWC